MVILSYCNLYSLLYLSGVSPVWIYELNTFCIFLDPFLSRREKCNVQRCITKCMVRKDHLVMKKNHQMITLNYQALNAPPSAPLAAIGSKYSIPPGAAAPGIGVTWF